MNRLLRVLLFLSVMTSGVAFGQGGEVAANTAQLVWQKVDPSTEWGKWLIISVKPYWEQMKEASRLYALEVEALEKETHSTEEAMFQRISKVNGDLYQTIQKINPPEEFKPYHLTVLAHVAEIAKPTPYDMVENGEFEKRLQSLGTATDQELERIFKQHGVPPELLEEFKKS